MTAYEAVPHFAAFGLGLAASLLLGFNRNRVLKKADPSGSAAVKNALTDFYIRLMVDGGTLLFAYFLFRQPVLLLLTATGLLAGNAWSTWRVVKRMKEGDTG